MFKKLFLIVAAICVLSALPANAYWVNNQSCNWQNLSDCEIACGHLEDQANTGLTGYHQFVLTQVNCTQWGGGGVDCSCELTELNPPWPEWCPPGACSPIPTASSPGNHHTQLWIEYDSSVSIICTANPNFQQCP